MENIKFRGKGIDNDEWLYGHLTFWAGKYQIWVTEKDGDTHNYLIAPKTVGQWTGLFDKDKNEVYCGDIMYVVGQCNSRVKYFNDVACFGLISNDEQIVTFCNDDESDITLKVIGNVIDNPELIK